MTGATEDPGSPKHFALLRSEDGPTPGGAAAAAGTRSGNGSNPLDASASVLPGNLDALLHLLHHGVIIADAEGAIAYLNQRAETITGRASVDALGRPVADVLRCVDGQSVSPEALERHSVFGCQRTIELGHEDDARTVEMRVVPLPREYGDSSGYLYELRDVSETVRRTAQLLHDATHDPLTGLANRRGLIERLNQILRWELDSKEPESVLVVLDLDGFKAVNDECGHLSGDEMLRDLAQLLQTKTRKADTAARFGGDEFVMLLPACGLETARLLMEEVRAAVAAYVYQAGNACYRVSASIGIATIEGRSPDPQEILQRADAACYRAKQLGGDCVVVEGETPAADAVTALRDRLDANIAQRLAEARNYVLYGQSIHRADNPQAEPQRCEILLRVKDRKGGLIEPAQFLPVAHRHGFELEIDRWVITSTVRRWAERRLQGDVGPLQCFINLSRSSIEAGAATFELVSGLVDEWQLPPGVLCLEMNERDVLDCRWEAAQLIRQLREHGVQFALDAVGDGLYSLGYLKSLPVDYIKLSAKTVLEADCDAFYGAFVDALSNVSRSLGISLIGVGAESGRILSRFAAYQVGFIQGYALSSPAPFGSGDSQGPRPAALKARHWAPI